ncbi:MAG: NYN domain-containing protein [Asgard group archaeon]|nr:NYN domain-containing protein [Asgard group archaeon]
MIKKVGKALRIISDDEDKKKIAIILDGPTIMPELDPANIKNLKNAFKKIGSVRAAKIITDRPFSQNESELFRANGFVEEIVGSEVDIHVTIEALESMNLKTIDIVAIGSTDTNLFPVFSTIKKHKELAIITWEKYISPAMESLADYIVYIDYLN